MKKLTKKEAYWAMYQGWSKLGADPLLTKKAIPELEGFRKECPACEYHEQHFATPSYYCPTVCIMRSLWPKGCMHSTSPYNRWRSGLPDYDRCFFALVIAEEAFWLYKLED